MNARGYMEVADIINLADQPMFTLPPGENEALGVFMALQSFAGDPNSYRSLFVFSDFARAHTDVIAPPTVVERIRHVGEAVIGFVRDLAHRTPSE